MCLQRRILNKQESSNDSTIQLDYDRLDVEFEDACNYVDIEGSAGIICTNLDLKTMFLNIRGLVGKQSDLSHLLYHCLEQQKN